MDFGNKLKELREESYLTQKQMAEILGVAKSNISKYESNTIEPSMDTLKKISVHFGISLDTLLGTEDVIEQKEIPPIIDRKIIIGTRIKQLRQNNNLTQTELGNKLNVIKQTISSWETGISSPSNETIIIMSSLFGVSVDYLLGNDVPKETSAKPKDETSNIGKQEEHISHKEEQLLDLYRNYLDKGFSKQLKKDLLNLFPEMETNEPILSRSEEKILTTFKNLNEDNQDIIIGKTKELLKEQNYENSNIRENNISLRKIYDSIPDTPEEFEKMYPPVEIDTNKKKILDNGTMKKNVVRPVIRNDSSNTTIIETKNRRER